MPLPCAPLWFSIPHITQISDTVSKKEAETNWFLPLFGGDKRDRTADLLNAIYSPDMLVGRFHYRIDTLLPIDFTGKKGN